MVVGRHWPTYTLWLGWNMSGCSYCGNSMASWRKRGIEVDTSDPNIYSFCKENKYRLVPRDYPIGTKHGSISLDPGYIASFRQQFHALFDAHGVYRPDDRTRRVHGKNHRRNSHIPKPENWRRGWEPFSAINPLNTKRLSPSTTSSYHDSYHEMFVTGPRKLQT